MIPVIFQLVIHSPFYRRQMTVNRFPITEDREQISEVRVQKTDDSFQDFCTLYPLYFTVLASNVLFLDIRYSILDAVQKFRDFRIALSSIENPVSRIENQAFCPGYVTCSLLNSPRLTGKAVSTFTTLFSIKTLNVSSARGAGALMTFPAMSNAEA